MIVEWMNVWWCSFGERCDILLGEGVEGDGKLTVTNSNCVAQYESQTAV